MSVFSEIIFIRILFGSGLLLATVTIGAFVVVGRLDVFWFINFQSFNSALALCW